MMRLPQIFLVGLATILALIGAALFASRSSLFVIGVGLGGRVNAISANSGSVWIDIPMQREVHARPRGIVFDRIDPPWSTQVSAAQEFVESGKQFAGFKWSTAILKWPELEQRPARPLVPTRGIRLRTPAWLLFVPLFGALAFWWNGVCRRSARVERGECINCGYDLRGIDSDRCPECGNQSLKALSSREIVQSFAK